MAKIKTLFACQSCGHETSKWLGKCPECNEWNTFEEQKIENSVQRNIVNRVSTSINEPKLINEIEDLSFERYQSGISEFDRVLGDGITKGSLSLLGGEPGIGKSTLLMEVTSRLSNQFSEDKILYVSGEESESQIADRSKRLGVNLKNFYLYNETSWQRIHEHLKKIKPKFLVIDSIQTTISAEVASAAGSMSQIREVTYELMNYVKSNDTTCFMIGHVTKEGSIAGPKLLEHMVDTVIYFEGDQFGLYRILRVIKNRFGNTNEVGIFEMTEKGLKEVKNPSQYFLDSNATESFGRSLSCILEGSRALFVEIQALVVENKFGNGRRTTQGLDSNRLALLVAVIDKYFEIPLSYNDIYLNVVGGIKLTSRESDLSILASLLSSFFNRSLPNDIIFLGEVGLTGEVRSVPMVEARLKEINQLNYKKVVTSIKTSKEFSEKFNIEIIGISKAYELRKLFFS